MANVTVSSYSSLGSSYLICSLEPEVTLIGAVEGRQRKRGSSISSEGEGGIERTQRKRRCVTMSIPTRILFPLYLNLVLANSKSNDYENDPTSFAPSSASRTSSVPVRGASIKGASPHPNLATKTAVGDLSDPSTRRLLTDLILTLNATHPDYDFTDVKASSFKREGTASDVMTR